MFSGLHVKTTKSLCQANKASTKKKKKKKKNKQQQQQQKTQNIYTHKRTKLNNTYVKQLASCISPFT
jgi:hypothetical protein